jgi:hypothetical protein
MEEKTKRWKAELDDSKRLDGAASSKLGSDMVGVPFR